MKTLFVRSITFLTCALLLFCGCSKEPQKYYRMNSLWTYHVPLIQPFDFNGDGEDELLVNHAVQLDVVPQARNSYYHSFRMVGYESFFASPLRTGALDSVAFLIYSKSREAVSLDFLAHVQDGVEARYESNLFKVSLDADAGKEGFEQSFSHFGSFSSNGRLLELLRLNTQYNKNHHRGVLAYDMHNITELWRFLCGPSVLNHQIVNMDGDASEEIVLGTTAPSNGFDANGTHDDSSYVFFLEHHGALRWRRSLGGLFTSSRAFVGTDAKEHKFVVAAVNMHDGGQDRLYILAPKTGQILRGPIHIGKTIPFQDDPTINICADVNRDGRDEIVLGNSDGYVRILDQNLNLLRISKPYHKTISIHQITDLTGDGHPEIVCVLNTEKIVVLDHTLRELATFPLELQFGHALFVAHKPNGNRLLLQSLAKAPENVQLNIWRLLELEESLIPFETYTGAAKYFWWGIGVLSVFSFWWIAFRERKAYLYRLYIQLLKRNRAFDNSLLLSEKGKIIAAGWLWEDLAPGPIPSLTGSNLRQHLLPASIQASLENNLHKQNKTIPKLAVDLKNHNTPVSVDIEYIRPLSLYHIVLRLLHEENLINNIKHWSQVAQKLAHGIKNPLTAIKLNSEELEHRLTELDCCDVAAHEYLDSIAAQIDKLRRMADGFMRFVEYEELNLASTDINQFIEQFVAQERDNIPSFVHISIELDRVLPYVYIDATQFKYAFENVFYNAVQSVAEHGVVHISTHFVQLLEAQGGAIRDFVEVRIQDNGVGIPADALHRVTQPYYTTKKEGTGLGLSLVVKIIEMHEGHFEISSSQGEGTTVAMRLKAVN